MQNKSNHIRQTFKLGWLAAVVFFSFCSPAALADIYKYVDKYGRVTLTDRPDRSGYQKLVRTWKGWVPAARSFNNPSFAADRRRYEPVIAEAAAKNNLPRNWCTPWSPPSPPTTRMRCRARARWG